MRLKLVLASFWTLTLLISMLGFVFFLVLLSTASASLGAAIVFTIFFNLIVWLLSPRFTDWVQRHFYKTMYFSPEQFKQNFPQYYDFIAGQAQQNKFPFPKIGLIPDDNPTAFSYGSGRWNSRLVFTKGILTYLNEDEVKAVLGHEVGHIVHRDFIVMSIANTIIQLLYEIYYVTARGRGDRKGAAAAIGLVSYIFYLIGVYIVLFLNRLREYYADEYSGQTTGQPQALSDALVKIAYGIMAREESASSKRLLESTKTMGIMSLKSAKTTALAVRVSNMAPDKVSRVMLFDLVSPWAALAQIGATHPLTGRRILRMEQMATGLNQPLRFNLEAARSQAAVSESRLWGGFFRGVLIYFAPGLCLLAALLMGLVFTPLSNEQLGIEAVAVMVIFPAVFVLRTIYKFPIWKQKPTDVLTLMSDVYASPIRGSSAQLSGWVVGRGTPGYVFSSDMMFQDNTGLMYLDYKGPIPLISGLRVALKKFKDYLGQPVVAEGWFFRSNTQALVLKRLSGQNKGLKSYPRLWSLVGGVLVGLILAIFALVLMNINLYKAPGLQNNTSPSQPPSCSSYTGVVKDLSNCVYPANQ